MIFYFILANGTFKKVSDGVFIMIIVVVVKLHFLH